MNLTLILLIGVLSLIIVYLFILRQRYKHFEERSIPTPPFRFLFGHLKTLWSSEFYSRQLEKWAQTYGQIYGIFEGSVPIYVTSDVDFLQEVLVKQFSNFHGRKSILVIQPRNKNELNLLNSDGAQWRRQRHACSSALSDGKLKQMNSMFNRCVEEFLLSLSTLETTSEQFNIYPIYKRTCVNIMCVLYGLDIESDKKLIDGFAYHTENLMSMGSSESILFKLIDLFPFLAIPIITYNELKDQVSRYIYQNVLASSKWEESPVFWLKNQFTLLLQSKSLNTDENEQIDLLQLIKKKATSLQIKDGEDIAKDQPSSQLMMNEEAVSNAFLFFTSGYLGPSATLAYSTYVLAKNENIQEKLQKEIDDYFPEMNTIPDYDTISAMPYLDLFVREVLRMWPISISDFNRQCMKSTNVNGIEIPRGAFIQVDIYSINFNSDLWGPEDPYIFYPERHQEKRHPLAYLSFGTGPRSCIGTRLSLIETKSILIGLLRHYTIIAGEHLETHFTIREQIAITPKEIWIKLIKRK